MIVGSGFGGAVAALRLADHGIRTVLVERGRRWPVTATQDTFASLQAPDGRSAWLSDVAVLGPPKPIDRFLGVLELMLGDGIAAFAGAGWGGGSLVFGGALIQPTKALFERAFRHRVDYDEMNDVYYQRARTVIKPSPCPEHILQHRDYRAARNWLELGYRAGLRTNLIDLAVDWNTVHEELNGGRTPSVIAGDFWYGNNSGAKLSLDRNYLHRAERSGYLETVTQHNVESIHPHENDRFRVVTQQLSDDGTVTATHTYVVRRLFLAAGSLGTSRLLTRARGRHDLPKLNAKVGTHWGNNGDFFSALEGLRNRIQPNLGGTVPVMIQDPDNEIMPTTVECFADWTKKGQHGLVSSVGMAPIPGKGHFQYNTADDKATLVWPRTDPEVLRVIDAGTATYNRLADAGDEEVRHTGPVQTLAYGMPVHRLDVETTPIDASATAHPLGGMPLDGATDNIGRVRHYPGLYVIDGSLIPGHTGCVNPALTITALAERNIERIIDQDF